MLNRGIYILLASFLLSWTPASSAADSFGYSGRLVMANGMPVTGKVDLRFDLAYSNNPTDSLSYVEILEVELDNGIFTVELDFPSFDSVVDGIPPSEKLLITVSQLDEDRNASAYSSQSVLAAPLAYRAQSAAVARSIDDETVTIDKLKLQNACSDGQVLSKSGDSFECIDAATGSVTEVKAGAGINVTAGSTPEVSLKAYNCGPGKFARGIDASGNPICADDSDTHTAFSAGHGIEASALLAEGTILVDQTVIQNRVSEVCGSDEFITGINEDGTVSCEGLAATGVEAGTYNSVTVGADGRVTSAQNLDVEHMPTSCGSGEILESDGTSLHCIPTPRGGDLHSDGSKSMEDDFDLGKHSLVNVGSLRLSDDDTNYVEIKVPSAISSDYAIVLPAAKGSSGESLRLNSSGELEWFAPTEGSVTEVSVDAPLEITAGDQPKVSLPKATSASDGYLAKEDWDSFNDKQDKLLTGFGTLTNSAITASDNVVGAFEKAQGQISTNASAISVNASAIDSNAADIATNTSAIADNASDIASNTAALGDKADKSTKINGHELSSDVTLYTDDIAEGVNNLFSQWTKSGDDIHFADGNVGIGTDTPNHQNGGSGRRFLTIAGSGTGSSSLAGIELMNPFPAGPTNALGGLYFIQPNNGPESRAAFIVGATEGTGGVNGYGGVIQFATKPDNINTLQERMRINSSGFIGIGTTSPEYSLDIGSKTDAVRFPSGTTAQRPEDPENGLIRYNTDNKRLEAFVNNLWQDIAVATTGGSYLSTDGGTLSGGLTITSGGANITGGINANSGAITNAGDITGAGAMTVAAGGLDQNLTLSGSGTGAVKIGDAMTVSNSGSVGIGTDGGDAKFSILNNSQFDYMSVLADVATKSSMKIRSHATDADSLYFGMTANKSQVLQSANANGTAANRISLNPFGGNVGVGTSYPRARFHLSTDDVELPTELYNSSNDTFITSAGTPNFRMVGANDNATNDPKFIFTRSRGSFLGIEAVQNNDYLGSIVFGGYSGSPRKTGAQITGIVDGTPSETGIPGALIFQTTSVSATPEERMRISSSGKVGIGTDNPSSALTIANTTPDTPLFTNNRDSSITIFGSGATYFQGRDVTNGVEYFMGTSNSGNEVFIGSMSEHNLTLRTGNQKRMLIGTDGNVAIGANAPPESHRLNIQKANSTPYETTSSTETSPIPTGAASIQIHNNSNTDNSAAYLNFRVQNSNSIQNQAYMAAISSPGSVYAPDLVFGARTGSTSYAERMRISSSGNVGIGTTNPASKLHIHALSPILTFTHPGGTNQDNTGVINFAENDEAGMKIRYDGTPNTGDSLHITSRNGSKDRDIFTFKRNGNIGIGTTSPLYSLDIGSKTDAVRFPSGTTDQRPEEPENGLIRYNTESNKLEAFANNIWQDIASAATGSSYLSSTGGTLSGGLTISSGGLNLSSGAISNAGNITGEGAMTVAAGGTNQNLTLSASGTGDVQIGDSANPAMTVSSNGNVSIGGVPNPSFLLSLTKNNDMLYTPTSASSDRPFTSDSAVLEVRNTNDTPGTGAFLTLRATREGGIHARSYIGAISQSGAYAPNLVFGARTGNSSYEERMRIDVGGRVGIGTDSPNSKLTVASITPDTPILNKHRENTVSIFGDGATYFQGRDVTNGVEYTMGTSTNGDEVFVGSMSNHNLTLRTNNEKRMTIDTDGKVGIGTLIPGTINLKSHHTTFPDAKLDVRGEVLSRGLRVAHPVSNGAEIDNLVLSYHTNQDARHSYINTGWAIKANSASGAGNRVNLNFYPGKSTSYTSDDNALTDDLASSPTLSLGGNGNIGIGTDNPTSKLSVFDPAGGNIARFQGKPDGENKAVTLKVLNSNTTAPENSSLDLALISAVASAQTDAAQTSSIGALGNNYSGQYGFAGEAFLDASTHSTGLNIVNRSSSGGPTRFSFNATEAMRITWERNVGIGTTAPGYMLDVAQDINAGGCVRAGGTSLGGTCSSDERLKSDIKSFDLGLHALLGINPKLFVYNGLGEQPASEKPELGVIAQEVEKVAPELVSTKEVKLRATDTEKTEIKQVNYTSFIYVVINSVKELYHQIVSLSERVDKIESGLEAQSRMPASVDEERIKNLEAENKELRMKNEELEKRLERIEKLL